MQSEIFFSIETLKKRKVKKMGLSKLIRKPKNNEWARSKAEKILYQILNQNLIMEAYLFGSSVDGAFTEDSDLDFLIVVENEKDIQTLQKEVHTIGFADIATDWIFKTKDSFEERKDYGGVCFEAFHFGVRLK